MQPLREKASSASDVFAGSQRARVVEFSLFAGDPVYKLFARLGLVNESGLLKSSQVAIFMAMLTWGPAAILAAIEGIAVGSTPRQSYLYDFAAYAQYLFAMPLLIIFESYVDREMRYTLGMFRRAGIIRKEDWALLRVITKRATEISVKTWPHLLLYLLAHALNFVWLYGEITNGLVTWHDSVSGTGWLSLAGWWNGIVSNPLLVYWILRWVWKVGIWYQVLWKISRLDLRIRPGHPDRFGGLAFLASLQSRFGFLVLSVGVMFTATTTYKLIIEGNTLSNLSAGGIILVYIALAPTIFLMPLFFFHSQLEDAKRTALFNWDEAAARLVADLEISLFQDNAHGKARRFDEIVQASLALETYHDQVVRMHTFPVDLKYNWRLFASAISSVVPIFFQSPWVTKIMAFVIGKIH